MAIYRGPIFALGIGIAASCLASPALPQQAVAVRPQDDFYSAVNARWLANTPIPAEVPWISPYVVNTLRVQSQVRDIVHQLAQRPTQRVPDEARIADLYKSYLDQESIERRGLSPLSDQLERIAAINSAADLPQVFGELMRDHADANPEANLPHLTPFSLSVRADDRDARRYVLRLTPAGLGMFSRDYYLSQSPEMVQPRTKYRAHVAHTLALSGVTDTTAADRILALETRLAEAERAAEALHDPAASYNVYRTAGLDEAFPGFGWRRFLEQLGLGELRTIVVEQPEHLRAVARLASELPTADWRLYLRWQLLRRYAPLLPRAYREANFAFYDAALSGSRTERPRDDAAMLFTEGAMGEALGRLWVERHLNPKTKAQVTALAEQIRTTFVRRIRGSTWLEPKTKTAALEKLSKLLIKVAHPDVWTDYSDLQTQPDDLVGNARQISEWAWRRKLARLALANDRRRWSDVPQSTSAYYNRSTNELALPAGLLQAPWYDASADLASNLGALGAVIGHEMGHAFDDQGSHFDGDGNVRDWWTKADRARFERRVTGLVEQYGRFEPLPGLRVNGALSLSENIGDLTGLSLAHATLLRLRGGKVGQDEERRFFSTFCVRWRAVYRDQLIRRIVSSDGHPPQQYRCNGPLQNFEPFYRAYGVRRGDGMYRPEPERVTIW